MNQSTSTPTTVGVMDQHQSDDELVELLARTISPYGWRDEWWSTPSRAGQYPRNQLHVKENARACARDVIKVLSERGILPLKR
jgi:hypothetical protein